MSVERCEEFLHVYTDAAGVIMVDFTVPCFLPRGHKGQHHGERIVRPTGEFDLQPGGYNMHVYWPVG